MRSTSRGIPNMPVSRKRSCVPCRAAKARCSLTTPCTRCRPRNAACRYEQGTAALLPRNVRSYSSRTTRPIAPASQDPSPPSTGEPAAPSDVQWFEPASPSHASASGLLGEPDPPRPNWWDLDPSFAPLSDGVTGGNRLVALVHDEETSGTQSSTLDSILDDVTPRGDISLPWLVPGAEGTIISHDQHYLTTPIGLSSQLQKQTSDAGTTPATYQHKLLWPRQRSTPEEFFSNTVLLGQIMSYPQMISKGNLLPPFIFPRCMMGGPVAFDCEMHGAHQCLPEILAICSNMVQLFEKRTPASSSFIWKTMYAENERLRHEVNNPVK